MNHLVSPSLLSADFLNLERDMDMINRSVADWIHLDVMDGVFVPNISFGLPVVKAISQTTAKPLDVHLMIVDPDRYVEDFARAGATIISVHQEACTHLHRTIQHIKSMRVRASVTLNPSTPVSTLEEILPDLDVVMLMSVNPGFGGQKFIESTVEKVKKLKALIAKTGSAAKIEIDGGVNFETGKRLVDAGADILVAGSFVFGADDPVATIEGLKNL